MNKLNLAIKLFGLFSVAGCATTNLPVATPDKCTPVKSLNISSTSRAVIDSALRLKIDSRRRKYNPEEFCAFNESTGNRKFYLLTIYDNVGNHRSETWVLLGPQQAINTKLDVYQMAIDDSLKTNERILASTSRLNGLDEQSKNELVKLLSQRAQRERKRGPR
jgi:hypothetical protein